MDAYRMRDARTAEFARRLLEARERRADMLPALPLTDRCWAILLVLFATLEDAPTIPVCDLVTYLDIPKSTILDNLIELIDGGYVTRERDPLDGRRTLARLTEEGRGKVRRLLDWMMDRLADPPL